MINIDIHVQCSCVEIARWMFINDLLCFTYSAAPKPGGHGPKTMQIIPSKYQWQKYKDQLHYYILLGVIPLSAVVLYANIYIGPATLCEIPEGYVPKQWEYYKVTTIQWRVKFPNTPPNQSNSLTNLQFFLNICELQHPVSRFFARYCIPNQQEIYERNMHYISELDEKRRMR